MRTKQGILKLFSGFRLKVISCFLLLTMVFQVLQPGIALALTSGPTQPEFTSFEPVNTTQLVDNFTGDFNYNIPLLTVPGPNGGYPINLAYHAGIGMDDEASWVGLGWNLNVGEINRMVRGIPDDFNGNQISKETNMRDNWTVGLGFGGGLEFGGKPKFLDLGASAKIFYNSYRGMGFSLSADGGIGGRISKDSDASWGLGFDLTLDSESGAQLSPNIGLGCEGAENNVNLKLTSSFSSRMGLYNIGLGYTSSKQIKYTGDHSEEVNSIEWRYSRRTTSSSLGFSGTSSTPSTTPGLGGFSLNFTYKLGEQVFKLFSKAYVMGYFNTQFIADKKKDYNGYGYMYLQAANDESMMDYNREKQFPIAPEVPNLPIPIMTHDIYAVKGQGAGGMFRAYRNDFGFLHEPKVNNVLGDANGGFDKAKTEITIPPGTPAASASYVFNFKHKGVNGGATVQNSYSGPWKTGTKEVEDFVFTPRTAADNDNDYREFYFKMYGEMTAEGSQNSRFGGYGLTDLDIDIKGGPGGLLGPAIQNKCINSGTTALSGHINTEREIVNTHIEHFTLGELRSTNAFLSGDNNIYETGLAFNESDSTMDASAASALGVSNDDLRYKWDLSPGSNDQVGAMRIRQNNGMVYEYGVPAYNTLQRDVMFSISPETNTKVQTAGYLTSDATTGNGSNSRDQYFTKTDTRNYAHSYLLTAVYSPDYVDIKGDGPTEDDLGYYTKFNYVKYYDGFQWRSPFSGASYNAGFYSDKRDDKGMYSYGMKEVYYLHSIETKTHVAFFFLENRKDGYGPGQEHNTSYGMTDIDDEKPLQRLRQIRLYKKGDEPFLLKTVNFEYDYSLCPGIPNNANTDTVGQRVISGENITNGKLTLKKVYFTHLRNSKGTLSPYTFEYGLNPNYNPSRVDRWGNYKGTIFNNSIDTVNYSNEPEPYVNQSGTFANDNAQAWNLKKIKLPSGGEIEISYEADDYAYVQDKKAMQMFRIEGIMDNVGTDIPAFMVTRGTANESLYADNTVNHSIIFKLDTPTSDPTLINKLVENIDNQHPLYFKAFMRLKKNYNGEEESEEDAYDYVEGYCNINKTKCHLVKTGGTEYTHGVLWVQEVNVKQKTSGAGVTHPFSKAAWEYMKISRSDLLYPEPAGASDLQSLANVFISIWNDMSALLKGYYKHCKQKKYGNKIDFRTSNDWRPSYVRLNTPDGIKYGGGHRVSKIVTKDNWNEIADEGNNALNAVYGVEYSYRMKDGTSSGVAAYEPLIGGDEIPLRLPTDRYSPNRSFTSNNKELYLTEPIGESFFPDPTVGYRRVLVRNSKTGDDDNRKTQGGINEYEFYTAKDFPVMISKTIMPKQLTPETVPVAVPGVFSMYAKTRAYSQGYLIELNNMHGQLRSMTTYPYGTNPDLPAPAFTSRTEYIYKTVAPYSNAGSNKLSNTVTVATADGVTSSREMGASTELFMDMQQNSSVSFTMRFDENQEWNRIEYKTPNPPPPWIVIWPYEKTHVEASFEQTNMRYVVTNKVINRHGILMETRTMKDGNTVTEKNLVFDPYTGEPILRTITNEFGDPIYHYAYKGHWYYENMKPSYINYRYSFIGTINSFPLNSAEAAAHLQVGDKVLLTGTSPQLAWVSNITGSTITFIDEEGETPAGTYTGLRVVETIRKNLQSVSVGGIVSLDNLLGVPGFGGNAPVFAAFNGFMDNYTHDNVTDYIQGNDIEVETCEGNLLQINMFIAVDGALGTSNDKLLFVISQGDCIYEIDLTGLDLDASDIDEIRLYYYNDDKVLLSVGGTDHILDLDFIGGSEGKCAIALPCINNIGVLNATATTMHDEWDYHFEDAGDPFASVVGFDVTDNPWRAGVKGIWRMKDQYAYQVHRKQSTPTNIAKDGTFKSFVKFDWFNPVENMNPSWTRTNTVTLYSPYGYELENRDVLGLYSSALYGHDQAVVTAVAGNSSYYETAFDGFEDYVDTVNNYPRGHGHVYFNNFVGSQNLPLKTSKVTQPHSGRYCIGLTSSDELTIDMTSVAAVSGTAPSEPYFTPLVSKKYIIVFWAKCGNGVFPEVNMSGAGLQGSPQTTISHQAIEGWYRVETIFETTNTPNDIEFEFHFENKMGTHSPGYIDDFRIQPFKSAMKAYAYDNNTLWLMAELDDRNYATFYNYDEEGNLVQIKKETERGIMTIQTGRKNVRKVGM